QESTCESLAYNLKERGYRTHAIHNHKGTFYDRNLVYANLGFDDFISAENMEPLEYTPRNWEKDGILTNQILKCLDSTEQQDFVFTVTVQTHGKYPTNRRSYVRHVRVEAEKNETKDQAKRRHQLEYYANQVYETDLFVGDLIQALEQRGEPTILLLYGDHLPALDLTEEDLTDGNLYQTDYVIWDNLGLEKQDGFLHCYQMSSTLMERIGFSNGLMTKYHQNCRQDSYYYENMGILEYDMLYGSRYSYGEGEIPYQPTELRFGLADVVITDVVSSDEGVVTVYGENFTTHSKLYINEEKYNDTVYIDEHTLTLPGKWLQPEDKIYVGQAATELENLGTSQEFIYFPLWMRN
ncbi:MAG: LTA synthase family protein, partial [Clostridia bacterium]|nr:LTA synthase family protein [Clostridia bacterium]